MNALVRLSTLAAAAAFATRLFLGGVQAFAPGKVTTLKPRVRARS